MKNLFFGKSRVKLYAGLTVFFLLVHFNSVVFAKPSQDKQEQPIEVDNFLLAAKSPAEVTSFLALTPERRAFQTTLNKHKIQSENVRYISISSNPRVGDDMLSKVTKRLNEVALPCEAEPVDTIELIIGAYQHPNGEREGIVMFVAHLKNGVQKLLAGLIADNDALTKKTKPKAFGGDFFATTNAACQAGSFTQCVKDCMAAAGYVIAAEVLACIIAGLIGCTASGWFYALCVAGVAAACGLTGGVSSLVGCALGCLIF